MELTLEAISLIVSHTGTRSEVAVLCRISKLFRRVAERALYDIIYLSNPGQTVAWSSTVAHSPRLASFVTELTISLRVMEVEESDVSDEDESIARNDAEMPEEIWDGVGKALRNTISLKTLIIHSQNSPIPPYARILRDTSFLLHTFHCDFDWDDDLVHFLNAQTLLRDLYILDFKQRTSISDRTTDTIATPSTTPTILHASSMPNLTTLECTFSEAVDILVPHRPISHLKTCFSRTDIVEKRQEMERLFVSISLASTTIRSLDIADSSYDEAFGMELLQKIVSTPNTRTGLRYLGTLVLPVDGYEVSGGSTSLIHQSDVALQRLRFYGLLMRLPALQTLELEITEWEPPPSTTEAFRALAKELRLYCPTVSSIILVLDFERTLITVKDGYFTVKMTVDTGVDLLWREI